MKTVYFVDQAGALSGPVTLPVVPGYGVQTPENAVELVEALPDCGSGYAWMLVEGGPVRVVDCRGVVYNADTGAETKWETLGELPDGFTALPPPGDYYVWRDGGWQLDVVAQKQAKVVQVLAERDGRLGVAQMRIAPLQYAANLEMATEQEKEALLAWMRYSVDLNRMEQQPGYPFTITWPVSPA
jgi:hypothetical protein